MTRERRIARIPHWDVCMNGPRRIGTKAKVINVNELGLEDLAEELRDRIEHLRKMESPDRLAEAERVLGLIKQYQWENQERAEALAQEEP